MQKHTCMHAQKPHIMQIIVVSAVKAKAKNCYKPACPGLRGRWSVVLLIQAHIQGIAFWAEKSKNRKITVLGRETMWPSLSLVSMWGHLPAWRHVFARVELEQITRGASTVFSQRLLIAYCQRIRLGAKQDLIWHLILFITANRHSLLEGCSIGIYQREYCMGQSLHGHAK